jgi:hypothetical protein
VEIPCKDAHLRWRWLEQKEAAMEAKEERWTGEESDSWWWWATEEEEEEEAARPKIWQEGNKYRNLEEKRR